MNDNHYSTQLRLALRSFHHGLHVLTSGRGAAAHAATVTWAMQISLKPRRVAVAVRKDSHIYPIVQEHGAFALSVVGEGQEAMAATFFKYVPVDDQRFADYPFSDGAATGAPLLLDAVAWLECGVVEETNAAGDHGLFIADVVAGGVRQTPVKALSLAATGWSYGG
jgi:flavin reductase (DIM6/NTAB) family NADH-FMN oxidoreductase RutF